MTKRKSQFSMVTGFVVMAIPASGLFCKDGTITTGRGRSLRAEEMILFKRRADAEEHVRGLKKAWPHGDFSEPEWEFPIVGVLVRERQ